MGFDLAGLAELVARHGRVARVVVTSTKGSTPREAGAAMLIWGDGQCGTIGGGTLEFQATDQARKALFEAPDWQRFHRTVPLGPSLGQCCGGSVGLLIETFGAAEIAVLRALAKTAQGLKRPLIGGEAPLADEGGDLTLKSGWLCEGFQTAGQALWIYGAGHVGRALVAVLPGLGFEVTWVDTEAKRFPDKILAQVTRLIASNPALVAHHAPPGAHHLILTYSHALDLELCHRLLGHSFESIGLIGSATKWARFRKRLATLGHSEAQIARITCPIGDPALGKSPEVIAVGVAAALLKETAQNTREETRIKEFAT
jgi:xanthine dehydrogenase accessory factor